MVSDRSAQARACANVALVKYWGKRDPHLNLPATGSISLTLRELQATAVVTRRSGPPREARFLQNGELVSGPPGARMATYLDLLAALFGCAGPLDADVYASFPVAAGLASSAAIHAAVAAAAAAVAGARLNREQLSAIARRGSGSAARSVFGGFVEWRRGERDDGEDSIALPLLGESEWDVAMAVAIVDEGRKAVSSRDAMEHVARTSPLYAGWLAAQPPDLAAARAAIAARDLEQLGTIAEANCLRMHATALAARPGVLYWTPTTVALMHEVRTLRRAGTPAYFTIDAGPQVKVLCERHRLRDVAAALSNVPGVVRVLGAHPGPGVAIVSGEAPWS